MIQLTIAPKRVLVVARALHGVAHLIAPLREAGCRVELATTPAEAIGRAAVLNPEVVVIEDQLNDVNSVELSVQIGRVVSSDPPPTFIMAVSSELSDDLPDAAEVEEPLCADVAGRPATPRIANRIADLMTSRSNEAKKGQPLERLDCHGLCLDRVRHRVWIDRRSVHLTPTEFKLLWELAGRPGCVLTRTELTKVCKGASAPMQTRTIDAHIKSIRRKLKDHAGLIETVHGIGYRFLEPE